LSVSALLIALIGGYQGVRSCIQDKPIFFADLHQVVHGNVQLDDGEYSLLFMLITITNSGEKPISPKKFDCFIKYNSKWIKMKKMLIPKDMAWDMKISFDEEPHKKDLQRFTNLIGYAEPIYGYLMFVTKDVHLDSLRALISVRGNVRLVCEDSFKRRHPFVLDTSKTSIPSKPTAYPKHGITVTPKRGSDLTE
jgi:hypothetical protein